MATNSKRQILFISFQAVEDPIFCVFDCTDDTDNIRSILIFIAISIYLQNLKMASRSFELTKTMDATKNKVSA